MFTLPELQMIQSLTRAQGVGASFEQSHIAASIHQKLIDNIAELESVENRRRAATALKVVKGSDAEDSLKVGGTD